MRVILLLVIAVYIRGIDVCNVNMCLTWTVQKDHLDLTCKVNYLKFHVEFYNNYNREQGYCISPIPLPHCVSKYPNTVIRQNNATNVTFLEIKDHIDSRYNGKWECRHGTNTDNAFVNITVLQTGVRCWQSYLCYTMLGFGFTILIITIIYIISLWRCYENRLSKLCNDGRCNESNNCFNGKIVNWCESHKVGACNGSDKLYNQTIESVQIGVFVVLFIILLMIPVVKGFQDDNICRDEELYVILGCLVPFICAIPTLRLTKESTITANEIDSPIHDPPPGQNGTGTVSTIAANGTGSQINDPPPSQNGNGTESTTAEHTAHGT